MRASDDFFNLDNHAAAWHERHGIGEVERSLRIFLHPVFGLSQFTGSCLPNAPKVRSGGSRALADGEAGRGASRS